MARRKQTAAEYIEVNTLLVTLVLGEMIEELGLATQAWSQAVSAARSGDLENALKYIVDIGIAVDIPIRIGRRELRLICNRAGNLLDAELPDDDDPE
jgi:hypothetical protein